MTVEAAGFIDDIDPTQPPGTDNFSEGDDHLRNFKKSVQDSLPNIAGAMTATHTELNNLDGYTGNTADLNILSGADTAGLTAAELQYVKGATSDIQTQIDEKETYVQSVTGTVAASALTLGLGAGSLNFRNSTLTSGAATANTNIALSLIVPNGATLGTSDTVESDLILLAIDNAGTTELAIANENGTVSFNEKSLISTTTIGTGSDSADVAYSTTARSNVAFRVVGLIRSTQATAGAWATSPSLLTGSGGNTLSSISSGNLASLDTVSSTEIDADSVRMSEIYTTIGAYSSPTVTASSVWSAPEDGIFFLKTTTDTILLHEMFFNGTWTSTGNYVKASTVNQFLIISGSTRIRNTSGSGVALNYQRVLG